MTKLNFIADGLTSLADFFNPEDTKKLLDDAMSTRDLNNLFLSEEEFQNQPPARGTNPRPGRNLIEKLETNFIFADPKFQQEMDKVCGNKWRILDYKFVMGVPKRKIPNWLNEKLGDRLVANLGPYIKEKYRDITYFRGIDFHQDIIDFPERKSDFITVYIYLDDVYENTSPLYVLTKSQKLGSSIFPHKLQKIAPNKYKYTNDFMDTLECDLVKLTGSAGTMSYWSANTLHGTQPHDDDTPRLSVRILVDKNRETNVNCELDRLNEQSKGSLSLLITRNDKDSSGAIIKKGNIINRN